MNTQHFFCTSYHIFVTYFPSKFESSALNLKKKKHKKQLENNNPPSIKCRSFNCPFVHQKRYNTHTAGKTKLIALKQMSLYGQDCSGALAKEIINLPAAQPNYV
jgi:hypothetical protein